MVIKIKNSKWRDIAMPSTKKSQKKFCRPAQDSIILYFYLYCSLLQKVKTGRSEGEKFFVEVDITLRSRFTLSILWMKTTRQTICNAKRKMTMMPFHLFLLMIEDSSVNKFFKRRTSIWSSWPSSILTISFYLSVKSVTFNKLNQTELFVPEIICLMCSQGKRNLGHCAFKSQGNWNWCKI